MGFRRKEDDKMARILILANFDVGLYKFRKDLIEELLRENEVWISLPEGDFVKYLRQMGCRFLSTPVDRRGMNPKTDFKLFLCYRAMLREVKPDLVITYTIKPNIYGGAACRLAGVPYAVNITGLGTAFQREGLLKTVITKMYRFACKKARTVFFENQANYQVLLSHRIVSERQSAVLPGAGINLKEYPCTEYPDTKEGYRFLFIGRVMQEKGIDELYEAAERIRAECQDIYFDIVGPYEDDYREVTQKLEREGIICYHGFQEDVKPLIAACHCFVLPSWHEGMANTLLEAAAMGRPLITSDIPGCREAVDEGKSGMLCPVKDADGLYRCIRAFLNLPDAEKAAWGRASRTRMEDVFDKKKVVGMTVERLMQI